MTATTMRTHQCGELRREHIGETVTLCGWVGRRREHGDKLAFVDLRDHTGITQCVVNDDVDVRSEYVIRVTGVVRERPEGTVNSSLPTGEVELGDCQVEILRRADPPPFPSTPAPTAWTRTSGSSTATWTCDVNGCSGTCACAPR